MASTGEPEVDVSACAARAATMAACCSCFWRRPRRRSKTIGRIRGKCLLRVSREASSFMASSRRVRSKAGTSLRSLEVVKSAHQLRIRAQMLAYPSVLRHAPHADAFFRESGHRCIEAVSKADIYIADLLFCNPALTPVCQAFKKLLGRDK